MSFAGRGRYRVVVLRWRDDSGDRITEMPLVRTEPMGLQEAFVRRRAEIAKLSADNDLGILTVMIEDEGGKRF